MKKKKNYSDFYYTRRRLARNRFALCGLIILSLLLLLGLLSLLNLTPHDPYAQNLEKIVENPSLQYWFGTDDLGRDIFSRIMKGASITLMISISSIIISMIIGTFLGAVSGYYGTWIDSILMRITDIFLALPTILFAMGLLAVLEPSMRMLIWVLGFLGWPSIARIIRAQVISIKNEDYIIAAKAAGISRPMIIIRHILPNTLGQLSVVATIGIAGNILAEAWLSFIGIGMPPPTPSWGQMLNESLPYLTSRPLTCFFPGTFIFMTVLAFNLLGDGLRDAFDPKSNF